MKLSAVQNNSTKKIFANLSSKYMGERFVPWTVLYYGPPQVFVIICEGKLLEKKLFKFNNLQETADYKITVFWVVIPCSLESATSEIHSITTQKTVRTLHSHHHRNLNSNPHTHNCTKVSVTFLYLINECVLFAVNKH
jgi:hypothetical protein